MMGPWNFCSLFSLKQFLEFDASGLPTSNELGTMYKNPFFVLFLYPRMLFFFFLPNSISFFILSPNLVSATPFSPLKPHQCLYLYSHGNLTCLAFIFLYHTHLLICNLHTIKFTNQAYNLMIFGKGMYLCNHNHSHVEHFYLPKKFPHTFCSQFLFHTPTPGNH